MSFPTYFESFDYARMRRDFPLGDDFANFARASRVLGKFPFIKDCGAPVVSNRVTSVRSPISSNYRFGASRS